MFKYIELFAGIGGFRQALDSLGGECVFASEIDPFATQSYKALYDDAPELHGDITKIDAHDVPDHDILVGGFPCQAFSVAGQRKGFEEARGTLFFEIARIASAKQPRLMLLENVKGLLSHDGGKTFETMCVVLNDIGYAIDFRVLNSKHYGVPQNRERIFIVCNRDAEHADWNVSGNGVESKAKRRAQALGIRTFNFDWPANDTVTTRLRDVLETNVDERYYLSEEKTAKLIAQLNEKDDSDVVFVGGLDNGTRRLDDGKTYSRNFKQGNRVYDADGIATALTSQPVGGLGGPTSLYKVNDADSPIIAGSLEHYGNDQMNRVYSVDGISPTITVVSGGGREQKIAEPITVQMNRHKIAQLTDVSHCLMARDYKGFGNQDMTGVIEVESCGYCGDANDPDVICAKCWASMPGEEVRPVLTPDRPEKRQNGRRFKDDGEESFTLTAQDKHGVAIGTYPRYRIRKLTPLECWRLQGFSDEAHNTVASAGISDSQRYKQAGNAVTVNVIRAIGERLIESIEMELMLQ